MSARRVRLYSVHKDSDVDWVRCAARARFGEVYDDGLAAALGAGDAREEVA